LESMSGEETYPQASAATGPGSAPAYLPSGSEFGTEDKHNWQGRSDERIKLAVMTALHWDLAVPRDRVQVNVSRGWVILIGRVMREYEKARAEADARATAGVAGVINRLTCEAGD
jgi:osmotically-inducible protein OsmY